MPLYRFVDAPVASPTVLLDLDDQSPLTVVEGASTSPPNRRVSSFGSAARNGDVLAQKSYPDRQITIPLEFAPRSTAEQHSETIQKLARLLDGGAWLQWQHDGKIEPVFYRTKFGDIEISDSIADETPLRYVTLTITAEYAAYGLPVTGTATIANDPTAATNPMSYVFPDVQGDVATPLLVKVDYSATSVTERCLLLASNAMPPGVGGGAVLLDAGAFVGTSTGWTRTVVADATAIGGSKVRFTNSTGVTGFVRTVASALNVERGDYRLLCRIRQDIGASNRYIKAWPGIGGSIDVPAEDSAVLSTPTADWQWLDLGVARMPGGAPMLPDLVVTDLDYSMNATIGLWLQVLTPGAYFDVDTFLLIPSGLDRSVGSALLEALQEPVFVGSQVWADGINRSTNLVDDDGVSTTLQPLASAGGFPSVTPGADNTLFLVPHVSQPSHTEIDTKTETYAVTWLYLPRYLYDRPATS